MCPWSRHRARRPCGRHWPDATPFPASHGYLSAFVAAAPAVSSVRAVPAEDQGGPAESHPGPVRECDPPHRLAVDECAVGGAEIDEHHITILDPDLGVVPRNSGIYQPQVAVGATAEDHQGRADLIGALVTAIRAGVRAGDKQARIAAETAGRLGHVTGRAPDLAVLDGRAADHARQDPECPGAQVADALETHPDRSDERVALFLGIFAGKCGELDSQAVGIHIEARVVVLGHLDDKIVRYQSPALGHDGRPVVHLALDRARHLDRLKFRLERPCKGTLDHTFEPVLKPLQDSHPGALLSCPYPMVSAMWDSLRTC